VFLADTTIEKQNFALVKNDIIQHAQSERRQEKSMHRYEEMDEMLRKLDSILSALPDTIR